MVSRAGTIPWNCHMLEWFQMSCDSIFGSPVIRNHSLSIHFGWHFTGKGATAVLFLWKTVYQSSTFVGICTVCTEDLSSHSRCWVLKNGIQQNFGGEWYVKCLCAEPATSFQEDVCNAGWHWDLEMLAEGLFNSIGATGAFDVTVTCLNKWLFFKRAGTIPWNCHMLEWFQMSCDSIFGSPVIRNHSLRIHFGWHFTGKGATAVLFLWKTVYQSSTFVGICTVCTEDLSSHSRCWVLKNGIQQNFGGEWYVKCLCAEPATSFQEDVCNAGWHWDLEMLAEGLFNSIGATGAFDVTVTCLNKWLFFKDWIGCGGLPWAMAAMWLLCTMITCLNCIISQKRWWTIPWRRVPQICVSSSSWHCPPLRWLAWPFGYRRSETQHFLDHCWLVSFKVCTLTGFHSAVVQECSSDDNGCQRPKGKLLWLWRCECRAHELKMATPLLWDLPPWLLMHHLVDHLEGVHNKLRR